MSDLIEKIESRYTDRANPRRGYHDSEDIVTFKGGTEEEQRKIVEEMSAEHAKNNMWAYAPKKIADNVWRINYGYDSGD